MINYRHITEEREQKNLSPHAALAINSQGRTRPENEDHVRTCFQRDRDRVLHCKSFRRLAHKTQVFLSPEGDHYRTRITHTWEVAQIARTITRALNLNEDLTEAIALGHDLGHTPFGHAGEAVLNRLVSGGFHHVLQSLRVVDILEREGTGLNLSFEVRDGIRKHSKGKGLILAPGPEMASHTLEGQVVRVADIIAYLNHDLDDAMRAKLLTVDDIPDGIAHTVGRTHSERITNMVLDVLAATDLEKEKLIKLSPDGNEALTNLRAFLYERVYDNPTVHHELMKAEHVLQTLWEYFAIKHVDEFRAQFWPAGVGAEEPIDRAVCDFLAGMTDRYAMRLYEKLFLPRRWSVL